MKDNEIKLKKTFNDITVCRFQFDRCDKIECPYCNIKQWMNYANYKKSMLKCFFCLILLVFLLTEAPCDKPPKPDAKLDYAVNETLKTSRARVVDFNLDGKINCIDYAISFKRVWDWLFVNFPENECVIIRNLSPTMNHLFVAIWYKDRWWEVEPQAEPPEDWRMANVWGDKYNPSFNIYGETDYWLGEVKVKSGIDYDSSGNTNCFSSSGKSTGSFISLGRMESIYNTSNNNCGWEISYETLADEGDIFAIFAFDYIDIEEKNKKSKSWLLGFDFGYGVFSFFQPYFGSSLGMKWKDDFSWNNISFAWKVNTGIRIPIYNIISVRFDISYGTILGLAKTISIGINLN